MRMSFDRRWLYALPALVAVGLAWWFSAIAGYLIISGVLALIGQPLMGLLLRIRVRGHKMPAALAALLTLLSMLGAMAAAVGVFVPLLAQEARRLSRIQPEEVIAMVRGPVWRLQGLADQYRLGDGRMDVEAMLRSQLTGLFDVQGLTSGINYALGLTGDVFIGFFAICFITFFFLKDRDLMRSAIMALVPREYEERIGRVLSQSKELLTRYFIGIIVEMVIVMTVVAIGMSLLGIRNAVLIGFLAGLLNVIPYVGPLIGAAMGIVIGIATNAEGMDFSGVIGLMGKMALVYAAAQLLDNIVLQPLIYSRSVKAHPLEIFLVIIMAGTAAGIAGMILAVPAYSILRVLAGEFLTSFRGGQQGAQ